MSRDGVTRSYELKAAQFNRIAGHMGKKSQHTKQTVDRLRGEGGV